MFDFRTNYKNKPVPNEMGENAKRLEEMAKAVNWKPIIKFVLIAWSILLSLTFTTIVVIRLALKI